MRRHLISSLALLAPVLALAPLAALAEPSAPDRAGVPAAHAEHADLPAGPADAPGLRPMTVADPGPAPAPGAAEIGPPMTAAQFDARTRGKTITYSAGGRPYGIEEYRPGQKVVWAFEGAECREGDWFQRDDQICFDYHDDSGLQCWTFHDAAGGLVARFEGGTADEPLISLQESSEPLNCPGPDIGV